MELVLAIVFSAFLFAPDASSWAADLGDMTALRKQPLDAEVLGASRKVPSVSLDGGEMTAGRLRVEYLETPQAIDAAQPRLSWELRDTRRAARQTAYRILVASDAGRLATDNGDLWDSGKVASTETLGIEYPGTPLTSRQRCFWKVQVWDADDRVSAWVGSGQYAFRAAKPPSPAAAADPGFVRIAENGAGLTLKGRPYRAIGVNIPHLPQAWMGTWFHRNQFYASPKAMRQAMVEAIEDAARHGVAFIRFFGSPGYPKETAELYHKDKAAYWRQMDELFARCRKHELKLVPSLGVLSKWHQEFGEPRSAVFDPKSKTHAATYGYVREFVTRYRDDPTVLMWELENEAFLKADVVVEGQPGLPAGVFPEGFTARRETYTATDNLRFEQLVDLYKEIAAFIKELDPNHLVTSGDSGVRPESQARRDTFPEFRWRKDTLREHLANLLVSQPEPLDVFSLHEYGNFTAVTDVGRLAELELLRAKVRAVHAARAPVFVGELGQRDPHLAQDPEAKWTRAAIDLLDEEGVALIALWVWHFPWQEADHNITTGAEQPLLMRRVGEFNRTFASAPPQ